MYDNIDDRIDAIGKGARKIALLAQDRLAQAVEALLDGDFDAAEDRTQEALAKLSSLARSQRDLGSYAAGLDVARAVELEEGAVIVGWGTVTSKELIEEDGHAPGVVLKWLAPTGEEGQTRVPPWRELVIKVAT